MINGCSVEALLIGFIKSSDMAMANTCTFSTADNFAYYYKRCLTDITLSDCMSVEVHPDDQSYESFEKGLDDVIG